MVNSPEARQCASCEYAELQCPPVLRCGKHGKSVYMDSPACDDFKPYEDEDE